MSVHVLEASPEVIGLVAGWLPALEDLELVDCSGSARVLWEEVGASLGRFERLGAFSIKAVGDEVTGVEEGVMQLAKRVPSLKVVGFGVGQEKADGRGGFVLRKWMRDVDETWRRADAV